MKKMVVLTVALLGTGLLALAHAESIDNGKALFESTTLGGSTNSKSCNTCHNRGQNLGKDLFGRNQLIIMGMKKNSLAEVVNVCIEKPLAGTAIDPNGEEMLDLISYLKVLVEKRPKKKRTAIEGC